jgi:hypothetical protein
MTLALGGISCQQVANNPAPSITSLSPATATAGGTGFLLTVNGNGFSPQAAITFNGIPRTDTIFLSSTQLTTMIRPSDIANAGTITVQVSTPPPGGGTSGTLPFVITPGVSGVPQLTSISPSSTFAGGTGLTLTVFGTNFNTTSVVTLNNSNRATSFVNAGELQAQVLSADLMSAGTFAVGVTNPPPGGGASATLTLTVTNPPPVITGIAPATFAAQTVGNLGTTLSILGSGFDAASQVYFNGSPRTTTFETQNSVTAPLLSADLITAGTFPVTVVNPTPGGGTSNPFGFSVIASTAGLGLPEQIDVSTTGLQANAGTTDTTTSGPAITSTGQYISFASPATNLDINDTNNVPDVFFQNNCIGDTTLLCTPATIIGSVSGFGSLSNGASSQPSVDSSGRYLAFVSAATNLIPGDNRFTGVPQVYWRDTCTGVSVNCTPFTILVSVASDGLTPGNAPSAQPSLSSDGRYVAYSSAASNLQAPNSSGVAQIFVFDTCAGQTTCATSTTLVSVATDGVTPGNASSTQPSLGALASYIAFTSPATNLLSSGLNGIQQVFQRTTCIGATGCTPLTILASTPDGTTAGNGISFQPSMGIDGRIVSFASTANNLVSTVTSGIQQVFLRDTCTGATGCTASTSLVSFAADGVTAGNAASEHPSVDSTGQYVAFASFASNLVAVDTNNLEDVFVRDSCATVTGCTASTVLVSSSAANGGIGVQGNGNSLSPAISADHTTVAFLSFATNLVPQGTAAQSNVFLASTTF